jgi:hypothetical protein
MAKNPEAHRSASKRYHQKHKNEVHIRKAKWQQKYKYQISKRKRKFYQGDKDRILVEAKQYRNDLFQKAIVGYGSECLFCRENRPKALIFHHVNEDGKEHREEIGKNSTQLHRWIIENNFPDEIILLCGTCHLILHRT